MNTVKSVYYGWGTLIVAGAGAYYFAKKSINADRAKKAEVEREKRMRNYQLEQSHTQTSQLHKPVNSQQPLQSSIPGMPAAKNSSSIAQQVGSKDWGEQGEGAVGPSQEASMNEPAPTRHAPEDEAQKMREKSKYEASDVFRSRKGDRFS